MATFYNSLGSQTHTGSVGQDRFYAFTYDQDLNNIRADATVISFSWTSGIRTSATTFFTITGSNVQTSSDFFAGGEKDDSIYGSNFNDAVFYNNGSISGGIGSFSSVEIFALGAGDDIIDLSARGASGIDYSKSVTIHGDAGNDIIIGGAGSDTLYGDDGNDLIFGYRGGDTIYGGAGNDTLYGDDLGFNGIAGDDFLYGQAGDDILYGGARTDRLDGGDGNDTLYGGSGGDNLFGGAGNDLLYGDDDGVSGNDKLDGGSGDDQLFGGDGNDELVGGSGTDILIGGAGNDFLNGGTGSDTAIFSGNGDNYNIFGNPDGSFTVTDIRPGSPDGVDTIRNVEFFQFADGTVPAAAGTPPLITSDGGGDSASFSVAENTTSITTVTAIDEDVEQIVSYSIVGGADAAFFSIDPTTGVLTFVAAPDFENPTDLGADNVYNVVVRATNGNGAYDNQSLSVTVTDVVDGTAPVITSNGGGATVDINISENSTTVTTVQAFDPDGTTPTYSIVGGVDAALFTIDPVTGKLVFNTAPDFESPTDSNGDGIYDVVVRATDGVNSDQQSIAVTVGNVNEHTPVITSGGGGATAFVNAAENQLAVMTVTANDADGTVLTYSIVGGADAALFTINPTTGALVFNSAPDFEVPTDTDLNGVYDVIIRASDGTNFDDQILLVTVTDIAEPGRTITGTSGNNSITPTAINVAYQTTVLDDVIYALAGNDIIDGGKGADWMEGGTGDDVYFVDQFSYDGNSLNDDQVIEAAGSGIDIVNSTVSYSLTANIENLTLIGAAVINGTGNELDNVITGNGAANVLTGGLGNDTLYGGGANDSLSGGAGADRLDGGTGADVMDGGADNDTYFVDTYSNDGDNSNDDQVIELAGGGIDTVNASVSYVLANEVENLTLTGAGTIDGTGNALVNILTGNGAANTLLGLDGADTLNGGAGDDVLRGGNGNDTLNGGTDNDSLYGDSGSDSLFGNAGNDMLDGGSGSDTLSGQAGNDVLIGGLGKDSLTGGTESDTFRFNFGDTSTSSSTYDTVNDFVTGVDKIDLDFVGGGLAASAYSEGSIATNAFSDAMASAQALLTAGKQVVFVAGSTDGWLFWDTDNNGIIDQSILLKGLSSTGSFDYADII
ncbi:MAG: cadherin domain-containing protein [Sphingorhabdus sp.]